MANQLFDDARRAIYKEMRQASPQALTQQYANLLALNANQGLQGHVDMAVRGQMKALEELALNHGMNLYQAARSVMTQSQTQVVQQYQQMKAAPQQSFTPQQAYAPPQQRVQASPPQSAFDSGKQKTEQQLDATPPTPEQFGSQYAYLMAFMRATEQRGQDASELRGQLKAMENYFERNPYLQTAANSISQVNSRFEDGLLNCADAVINNQQQRQFRSATASRSPSPQQPMAHPFVQVQFDTGKYNEGQKLQGFTGSQADIQLFSQKYEQLQIELQSLKARGADTSFVKGQLKAMENFYKASPLLQQVAASQHAPQLPGLQTCAAQAMRASSQVQAARSHLGTQLQFGATQPQQAAPYRPTSPTRTR